jgi:hypothetical protein
MYSLFGRVGQPCGRILFKAIQVLIIAVLSRITARPVTDDPGSPGSSRACRMARVKRGVTAHAKHKKS